MSIHQLKELLDNTSRVAIFGHRHPDGDCIGSLLGWGNFLELQGKKVDYFIPTKATNNFDFLDDISKIQIGFDTSKKYDILFFLDTATHDGQLENIRIDNNTYFEHHTHKIVIDHHISNTQYGDINIIKTTASSTCEIIAQIIYEWTKVDNKKNTLITPEIANYLLLGISTDTGHFKRATSPQTFSLVSWLLEQGGNLQYITDNIYRNNSLEQIQFTQLLLSRIQKKGAIIYTRYTQKDIQEYHLENHFVEQALDIMTSIKHDGIFLFFKGQELSENPYLRCSRRSKNPTINVAELASHFNGGGHRQAAGSQIPIEKDFQNTTEKIIKKVNNLLITQ